MSASKNSSHTVQADPYAADSGNRDALVYWINICIGQRECG